MLMKASGMRAGSASVPVTKSKNCDTALSGSVAAHTQQAGNTAAEQARARARSTTTRTTTHDSISTRARRARCQPRRKLVLLMSSRSRSGVGESAAKPVKRREAASRERSSAGAPEGGSTCPQQEASQQHPPDPRSVNAPTGSTNAHTDGVYLGSQTRRLKARSALPCAGFSSSKLTGKQAAQLGGVQRAQRGQRSAVQRAARVLEPGPWRNKSDETNAEQRGPEQQSGVRWAEQTRRWGGEGKQARRYPWSTTSDERRRA